jgi:hypothetical protein
MHYVRQQSLSDEFRQSPENSARQSGIPTAEARYQGDFSSLLDHSNRRTGESVGQLCPGKCHSLSQCSTIHRVAQNDKSRTQHPRSVVREHAGLNGWTKGPRTTTWSPLPATLSMSSVLNRSMFRSSRPRRFSDPWRRKPGLRFPRVITIR